MPCSASPIGAARSSRRRYTTDCSKLQAISSPSTSASIRWPTCLPRDEINRSQARQFITMLRKLAIVANGSVVLLAHPSQSGIATGSGTSGSTAWHNSVRGRIYMQAAQGDDDLRVIQFKKNQYGRLDDSVKVRYQNGVYVPDAGKSSIQRAAEDAKADALFLELLTICYRAASVFRHETRDQLCTSQTIRDAAGERHAEQGAGGGNGEALRGEQDQAREGPDQEALEGVNGDREIMRSNRRPTKVRSPSEQGGDLSPLYPPCGRTLVRRGA